MKLTSKPDGSDSMVVLEKNADGPRVIRLVPPDRRAVDGDAAGPMPVVDVWFHADGHLEGRICWASAEPGNSDRLRDFEDPEQYAPTFMEEE